MVYKYIVVGSYMRAYVNGLITAQQHDSMKSQNDKQDGNMAVR
jgi:hypothetical protein